MLRFNQQNFSYLEILCEKLKNNVKKYVWCGYSNYRRDYYFASNCNNGISSEVFHKDGEIYKVTVRNSIFKYGKTFFESENVAHYQQKMNEALSFLNSL